MLPSDPRFRDSGPIEYFPIVFPGTHVWIRRRREKPFLADRNHVLLYNRHQRYARREASPVGDRCHWFSFSPVVLAEVVQDFAGSGSEERPFAYPRVSCESDVFLNQQLLIRYLEEEQAADPLFIEESYLDLLQQVFKRSQAAVERAREDENQQGHEDLVGRVLLLLSRRFREALSLEEIANEVYSSPYHLSRVFRRRMGWTIHAYRHQIRLRTGLEEIVSSRQDLTEIALDLGFSSHSHFTAAFRSVFDCLPSALRKSASSSLVRKLRGRTESRLV